MVAGHLTLKNGKYYAVLNYKNAGGQRKTKWISLGLSEKGNKRKAEAELARLRAEFEPPKEVGDLSSDMLFADYLLECGSISHLFTVHLQMTVFYAWYLYCQVTFSQ